MKFQFCLSFLFNDRSSTAHTAPLPNRITLFPRYRATCGSQECLKVKWEPVPSVIKLLSCGTTSQSQSGGQTHSLSLGDIVRAGLGSPPPPSYSAMSFGSLWICHHAMSSSLFLWSLMHDTEMTWVSLILFPWIHHWTFRSTSTAAAISSGMYSKAVINGAAMHPGVYPPSPPLSTLHATHYEATFVLWIGSL